VSFAFFSFTMYQNSDWKVPDSAKNMKNPVKADNETLAIGKTLYSKHCKSCHGKNGEGDGTKAEELETFPGDFTSAEFQKQTDGAIFYKTSEGRDDMPSFDKKIPSKEDRWILVNYLRSLK
ncbi:MAG: c-type cytochrome, partial [Cyclobacteriaceae bacterium]|nr:c-type cytochrome [Cyclobacteriaceae bacterium]